jgi:competence protein ComEC
MKRYGKQFWPPMPFIRLLMPLTAGIMIGQYFNPWLQTLIFIAAPTVLIFFVFSFRSLTKKYSLRWLNGLFFNLLMLCMGSALVYFQNIKNDPAWIGRHANDSKTILVTLQEPLTAKTNSFKTTARVTAVWIKNQWVAAKGDILVYFKKDSVPPGLQYGSELVIQKTLQPISNSGNPGAFDYKQYAAFQGIHLQVYLQQKDYRVTGTLRTNGFQAWLISARNNVLAILRKYIPGEKEAGVAEALLIGYRDDLDKDLVRSYSNTGVVHIIAISGLHLGMIYGLLLLLLKPFRKIKWMRVLKPLLILTVLWGFSLLAGAAASILRSAVMFSFIVIGESMGRRTNMFNTLAASAFCLLVYDPYFLWDVGFQLSYAAVLSIVLFMKPVYTWLYFPNKFLNAVWQLNAITLSAQVLTLPIILYYFHQFPNLFLFTNFIAVPVSGFILYGELLLLVVYKIPLLNEYTGKAVSFLVAQMNGVIERTDHLPYAATGNIQVSIWQTILLYFATGYFAWWLLEKKTRGLLTGLCFLLLFIFIAGLRGIHNEQQQKLIIYNIPQHSAIDIISGTGYQFIGDTALSQNIFLNSFHLAPSRILHGARPVELLHDVFITNHLLVISHKTVLLIDKPVPAMALAEKIPVDIIILSGNPKIYLGRLAAVFDCPQYVFDSSNPLWKIRYWKKDADSLHLRHHSVPEQGAFEMAL